MSQRAILYFFFPKSYYRFDKVCDKNIYFRNVSFMDDVIQLRNVVVYKYASMNIYDVSLCSLLWNVFIWLNIYGDKEQSLRKSQVMSFSSLARIIQSFGVGFLPRWYSLWSESLIQDDGCKYEHTVFKTGEYLLWSMLSRT